MKRILLSTLCTLIIVGLFANDLTNRKSSLKINPKFIADKPVQITGFETDYSSSKIADIGDGYAENNTAQMQSSVGELVGHSTYDLQTNIGVCRRVTLSSNTNFVHTGWTGSQSYDLIAPDRGTRYNYMSRSSEEWQTYPDERIEPMTRIGWPNLGFTESGRMFSISHTGTSGMMFCYRTGNQSTWNETIVGNLVGDIDGVWARSAVDGDKIHVIISRSETSFAGVDGGVNYIRSLDAGDTWESMGSLEPDYSSSYARMGADAYQIDAQDGNVAIIFGYILAETNMYLSNDDGENWTKTTLVESSNPTVSNIADPNEPYADFSVDPYWGTYGGNTIIFDSNNMPHVVYSAAFQFNSSNNDWLGAGTYFPMVSSTALWYWNPTMDNPEIIGITVLNDNNADGVLGDYLINEFNEATNIDGNILTFTNDMVGEPQLAIDEEDNLYVSYSAQVDGNFQPTEVTVQTSLDGGATTTDVTHTINENTITYRDVFLIKKQANGTDWQGPLNVTESDQTDDLYASIQRDVVDNTLYMIYQSDPLAGQAVGEGNGHEDLFIQNEERVETIDVSTISNEFAAQDSEPYILPVALAEPVEIAQGCEFSNNILLNEYIVGMDYPEGFVPVEFIGGIDYSIPGDYVEVLQAVDSQGNVSDPLEVMITILEDTEAPIMEVAVPCNDFAIIAGSIWENPPVTISDNSGCDLYPLLQTQSSVDPTTVGEYTLVYNVSDYAGNAADPLTLNVSVIAADTDGPEVTFVNAPDVVNVYGVIPTIEYLVVDNVDCEILDYTVEGLDDIETSIPGIYTITVTATDAAGNTSVATHTIEVLDNIAPSISLEENPVNIDDIMNCGDDGIFDLTDLPDGFIEVDDNFSNEADLVITSDFSSVDCNVNGEYEVDFTVTDEAGNIDEATLTVVVDIVGIEDNILNNFVDIYPNPTQDLVNVDASDIRVYEINVYNVVGELIYNLAVNNFTTNNAIDLSAQAEGIYLINVNTEEGSITKKLTISK